MRTLICGLAVVTVACSSGPSITVPSAVPDLGHPATLQLLYTTPQPGTLALTASIRDGRGAGIASQPITLSTDAGTLAATALTTDDQGRAETRLTLNGHATLTATAGILATWIDVTSNLPILTATLNTDPAVVGSDTVLIASVMGTPRTFAWDFGDGQTTSGTETIRHRYAHAGAYPASVQIADAYGQSVIASCVVSVFDPPPPPPPTPVPSPALAMTLTCSDSQSSATANPSATPPVIATPSYCNVTARDETGTIATPSITVQWNWADDLIDPSTTVVNQHQYAQPGVFTVLVTATQSSGRTGQTAATVTVH